MLNSQGVAVGNCCLRYLTLVFTPAVAPVKKPDVERYDFRDAWGHLINWGGGNTAVVANLA